MLHVHAIHLCTQSAIISTSVHWLMYVLMPVQTDLKSYQNYDKTTNKFTYLNTSWYARL